MNTPALDLNAAPVRKGCARLEVELVCGESAVTSTRSASPLKLLAPMARGKSVWAYAGNFGGGLVAGDQTRLDLRVGAGARCFLGTQASTKIYRNPARLPCSHRTRAVLETDSLLVFAPDAVQAFAGSSYEQRQEFHLGSGAGLVLVDWFTSGRAARGERWAFDCFQSRNEVFIEGERAFLDSLWLSSAADAFTALRHLGRFNAFAMLLLTGPLLKDAAAKLLGEISSSPVERRAKFVCSASPVRGGTVLRLAGEEVETVGRALREQLSFLANLLGDDPWKRKW